MMNDNASVFTPLRRNVENHFMVNFFGAILVLLDFLRQLADNGEESIEALIERYPFLTAYLESMDEYLPQDLVWSESVHWLQDEVEKWEHRRKSYFPLTRLEKLEGIGFAERMGLMCAGLVEEDSRFSTLFQDVQRPLIIASRPTVEFIGRVVLHIQGGTASSPADACQPLLATGLLVAENPELPLSRREARVQAPLWSVIRRGARAIDHQAMDFEFYRNAPLLKSMMFPPDFLNQLRNLPRVVAQRRARLLIMRGNRGSERAAALRAVFRARRRHTIRVQAAALGKEDVALLSLLCLMCRALPLIMAEPGPGENVEVPAFPDYIDAVGVVLGTAGGVDSRLAGGVVSLSVPLLGLTERKRLWSEVLAKHMPAELDDISSRFLMPGDYIRQAATGAIAYAALDDRKKVSLDDVRRARRTMHREALDALATPLTSSPHWDSLVTSRVVAARLKELAQRCRYRERVLDHLGAAFDSSRNRGVRALFNGASGTGKTLAARVLAGVLEIDIYRVDLASIVNKYIGETEKNLHRILARAEELDVILLLDEGDALMSKRTEVQSANDRYANLETNYLLQRLENHEGIVFVTTNAGDSIDHAFARRMDAVIDFSMPKAEERERIWQIHLPDDHGLDTELLRLVSQRCQFSGGQIRNVARLAALLALDDDVPAIESPQLLAAIEEEYRKAGAVSPLMNQSPSGPLSFSAGKAFVKALQRR